jgi:ATP-dependent protease HslVU (ClpYQ) peptidase subunit
MTTICFRAGVMATDSRAYSGDKMPIGEKKKLHRLSNGALVGSSSRIVGNTDSFAAWCQAAIDDGQDLPRIASGTDYGVQALLVWTDGTVHYWNDGTTWTGPLEADFFAIGSGEQFAFGAMKAGATAEEAVRIASECDPWTGGRIQTVTFEPSLKPERKKARKRAGQGPSFHPRSPMGAEFEEFEE